MRTMPIVLLAAAAVAAMAFSFRDPLCSCSAVVGWPEPGDPDGSNCGNGTTRSVQDNTSCDISPCSVSGSITVTRCNITPPNPPLVDNCFQFHSTNSLGCGSLHSTSSSPVTISMVTQGCGTVTCANPPPNMWIEVFFNQGSGGPSCGGTQNAHWRKTFSCVPD